MVTDVQRFRQCGYDGSLTPSTNDGDAHYMFYKDHAVVVSLLREQLEMTMKQLECANKQNDRLMQLIMKGYNQYEK